MSADRFLKVSEYTPGGGVSGLNPKQVLFGKSDGTLQQDGGMEYDPATDTLELGAPATNVSTNIAVFLGDSITSGGGVTTGGTRWSTLVAAALGLTENNYGVGGATVASYAQSNIPTKTAAMQYLFIAFGTNDAAAATASGYTTSQFQTDFTTLLNACIAKGWAYNEMILVSTYGCSVNGTPQGTYEAFNTVISNLVTANNMLAYLDVYIPLLAIGYPGPPSQVLTIDTLHPNNFGNVLIAQLIQTELAMNNFVITNQKLAINGPAVFSNIKIINPATKGLGQTLALFDASGNMVRGYAIPAGMITGGLLYLAGGLKNPMASDFFGFDPTADILLTAGARIGAGNNSGAYIMLFNPATGVTEFHNYFSAGAYTFSVKPAGGAEIVGFTINNDGTITPNVGLDMPYNKLISSSNAGTNSMQLFDASGNLNCYQGYEAGAFCWYVTKGVRNAANLGMTLDAQGNLSLNSNSAAFIPNKLTTAQRNALTPVEGMEIYNTDTHTKNFYNGSSWQQVTSTAA